MSSTIPESDGSQREKDGPSTVLRSLPDFEAMFPVRTALDTADPKSWSADELRHLMTHMLECRELDVRLTKLQRQGRIGFHIGSVGEEALMIGTAAALRPTDWVVPCYREAGVALYRGMPLSSFIANMFGTAEDPVKGRQMPCHYSDQPRNFLSISSPVGTQIAQAAGVAWAAKLRGKKDVAAVYFGDGATSQGDFHNGLNFAGVYKVPCVFICRNNQWAISTPFEAQTASKTVAQKALAYGVRGARVDGNDVLAVLEATREAVERARAGEGPTLLEMYTYRQGAHSTSDDPRAYREQSEVDEWLKKDPLTRFGAFLNQHGLWSDDESARVTEAFAKALGAAIDHAEATPKPDIETLFDEVYEKRPQNLDEQLSALKAHLASRSGNS